ncbi:ComEC/Rec2 family competence protein [Faecalibaculum rodentium]|uniref:ComEC/Rec2 family competence protein n=1 Tax=Faecalibaculum rodentium TaxID=1702221 RepID=UPI0025A984E4|nr:ComEC/Rec2 family competence protein [Faecalibaculum rodentium]
MNNKEPHASSWLLKPLKILLVAFLLGSSLAGCASDDDTVDEPQTQETETASDTTDSSGGEESKKTTEANKASEAPAAEEKPETKTDTQTYTASEMTVTYLDVGQASAALIESDGHYALIDGGNREDSDLIYTVLKNKGVTNLDVIIGSHSHEDHIGGLAGALNEATASTILCPVTSGDTKTFQSFAKYASEKGPGITVPTIGDTYTVGDAKITILGLNAGDDTNDTSIICSLQNGETSFLFSGDAEYPAEQAVLNSDYASLLKSNVYTVGHHGSDTSTSDAFLDAIDPQYGIISCGKNNSYGHPDAAVLTKLKDHGVKILRTDLQGDITCKSDGKTVACEPSKNRDADAMVPGTKAEDKSEADQAAAAPASVPQSSEYVLNTSTHKFHRPDCRSVAKMKDKNKEVVNESRDQIIAQGYEPCKICQP